MAHRPSCMCNVHTNIYFLREAADKAGSVRLCLFHPVVIAFKLPQDELMSAGCILKMCGKILIDVVSCLSYNLSDSGQIHRVEFIRY